MINICLFGASGRMGKAVISAAENDSDVNINNFIVREESNNLNKNVGEFHFGNLNEFAFAFESYPNKDFDLIIFPNKRHGFGDQNNYFTRRKWDYFVKHLLDLNPPENFSLD